MIAVAGALVLVAGAAASAPRCCTIDRDQTFVAVCDAPGSVIEAIDFASFGSGDAGACAFFTPPASCAAPVQSVVEAACLGQSRCELEVQEDVLGADPCPEARDEYRLSAQWRCSANTTAPVRTTRELPYVPPLRTEGSKILDATGAVVRLRGVNWYGGQCGDFVQNGLDRQPLEFIAGMIADLGFNQVRLQFSNELVERNPVVAANRLGANPQLVGMRALDIYEEVVRALGDVGVFVTLDDHTSDASWCCGPRDENGLWYNDRFPEEAWLDDWAYMARRFGNFSNVIAAELRNEVRWTGFVAPTWGDGNPLTDWHRAATLAGNRVLAENPDLLIKVTGINSGNDLTGARDTPVVLDVPNRVVYVSHNYPFWHFAPEGLPYPLFEQRLDLQYGFILNDDEPSQAPLMMTEFGACHRQECLDDWWLPSIIQYLNDREMSFSWWPFDGTMCDPGLSDSGRSDFGREEQLGQVNMCWTDVAYPPHYEMVSALLRDQW